MHNRDIKNGDFSILEAVIVFVFIILGMLIFYNIGIEVRKWMN